MVETMVTAKKLLCYNGVYFSTGFFSVNLV